MEWVVEVGIADHTADSVDHIHRSLAEDIPVEDSLAEGTLVAGSPVAGHTSHMGRRLLAEAVVADLGGQTERQILVGTRTLLG